MIQAAFSTRLVSSLGGRHTPSTARSATVVRAVRLAAVARDTDRKQLVAGVTGLLAERDVHGAADLDRHRHWTPVPFRGTTEGDCLGPMVPEVVTGVRRISPGPHLITVASAYLGRPPRTNSRRHLTGERLADFDGERFDLFEVSALWHGRLDTITPTVHRLVDHYADSRASTRSASVKPEGRRQPM